MSDGRPGRQPVPRYEVTVQGRGIALPFDGAVAIGFLRVVQLRARDPVDAETCAVDLVRSDWASSAHAGRNLGDAPYLTIRRIGSLNWWHRLLGAPRGYIFFAEDGIQVPTGPSPS